MIFSSAVPCASSQCAVLCTLFLNHVKDLGLESCKYPCR